MFRGTSLRTGIPGPALRTDSGGHRVEQRIHEQVRQKAGNYENGERNIRTSCRRPDRDPDVPGIHQPRARRAAASIRTAPIAGTANPRYKNRKRPTERCSRRWPTSTRSSSGHGSSRGRSSLTAGSPADHRSRRRSPRDAIGFLHRPVAATWRPLGRAGPQHNRHGIVWRSKSGMGQFEPMGRRH